MRNSAFPRASSSVVKQSEDLPSSKSAYSLDSKGSCAPKRLCLSQGSQAVNTRAGQPCATGILRAKSESKVELATGPEAKRM